MMKRLGAALVALVLASAAMPATASAHTEFDYSEPADGDEVDQPVAEIVVAFTDTVEPVGAGFEVLDPSGTILSPEVVTDDSTVFTLVVDPPLAGGAVGVRYEVMAGDGHVQTGGFSFTVAAPPPTTTSSTTTAPSTTVPVATTTVAPATTAASTSPETPATTEAPTTSAASTTSTTTAASGTGGFNAGGWLFGVIAAALILAALSWVMSRRRSSDAEPE